MSVYDYIANFVHGMSTVAIFLNVFLFCIVLRFSSKIGSFKYLLLMFSALETIFSVLVFVTIPIFYTYDYRVVVFSYNSLLSETVLANWASGLYCTFYELWISFVAIMFFHRYICLCREQLSERISSSLIMKILCFAAYVTLVVYCLICGMFFCTLDKIPKSVEDKIKEEFGLQNIKYLGYQVTTMKAIDGSFTWTGFMAFNNHFVLISVTSAVIVFCGYNSWKRINDITKISNTMEHRRNKQIMYTLLFQGSIPLLMYQIPCLTILLSSLMFSTSVFGSMTPMMTVLTTIPKVLDPLGVLIIIKEYRWAVQGLFRRLVMIYSFIMYAVHGISASGVVMNAFLFYIAYGNSAQIGHFKYFILAFSFLECLFSLITLVTVPMFYVVDYRLIVFSYHGILSKTEFASFSSGLHCAFYELWMSFVVVMFVNRYIVICKEKWRDVISKSQFIKTLLLILYICDVVYCLICGTYWCVKSRLPESVLETIRDEFEINGTEMIGYMVTTLKHKDNSFSYDGLIAFINHYVLIITSTIIIIYCGRSNWKCISNISSHMNKVDISKNRQIFFTMVLQGITPLLTYQMPSLFFLTYALLYSKSSLSAFTTLGSLLTTIPKLLDPLLALFIIKEYRYAVIKIFRGIVRTSRRITDVSMTYTTT